jgi:hypothetical protein
MITNFEEFQFQCKLAFLEDVFLEEEITELRNVNLIKPKFNQTSLYLFPSIKLESIVNSFNILSEKGFINLYSYYEKLPIEYCLHLVFNPPLSKVEEFEFLLKKFKKLSTFVEETKLDENVYIISVIIDDIHKNVFYPFINGQYSKMGEKYANLFPFETLNGKEIKRKEYHVITHSIDLQKKLEVNLGLKEGILNNIELDEKIVLKKEILNYNYIKRNTI